MNLPGRRLQAGLLALLVASLAGWVAPAGSTAAPGRGAVTIPGLYLEQRVRWQPCDFDFFLRSIYPRAPRTDCASLTVPMDWRRPGAHPDITIAVAFSRATGRSQGLLVTNPGGPGAPGLESTSSLATVAPRMFREFDLLGFDPRGMGRSQQADCRTSTAALAGLPVVADHRARSRAVHQAEGALARLEARACAGQELNPYVGTDQTVHDLEFLRAYLDRHRPGGGPGYDRLNYLGYSYGTWLGAWYADSYPERTGRFVLDSSMNWTTSMYGNQVTDSFSFQRRRDQMFFPWVARHHDLYRLGRTAARVSRTYERIRTGVQRAYLAGLSPEPGEALDAQLVAGLFRNDSFPDAAELLVSYALLAESDEGARRRPAADARAAEDQPLDPSQLVRCNDSAYSRDIAATMRRTDLDARRYPFVGYWNSVSLCNYWPFPATQRTVDLAGAPTMLMLQSEGDPATAYEGALAAHRASAGHTRLVSVDDEGQHGLYLSQVSPCVDRIADAFLFAGRLPDRDLTCAAEPLPDDSAVHRLRGPVDGRRHTLDPGSSARTATAGAAGGRAARGPGGDRPSAAARRLYRELMRRTAEQEVRSR